MILIFRTSSHTATTQALKHRQESGRNEIFIFALLHAIAICVSVCGIKTHTKHFTFAALATIHTPASSLFMLKYWIKSFHLTPLLTFQIFVVLPSHIFLFILFSVLVYIHPSLLSMYINFKCLVWICVWERVCWLRWENVSQASVEWNLLRHFKLVRCCYATTETRGRKKNVAFGVYNFVTIPFSLFGLTTFLLPLMILLPCLRYMGYFRLQIPK